MNADIFEFYLETQTRSKTRPRLNRGRSSRAFRQENESGFKCRHCHSYVLAEAMFSGVRNRNHCPFCLWSRCLDLFEAGDRLSPCKALMHPVGVTLKKTRKKYGAAAHGELMLVHQCAECGKTSANRIAADDDPRTIYKLYQDSLTMNISLKDQIEAGGVTLLDEQQEAIVRAQLFGKAAGLDELFDDHSLRGILCDEYCDSGEI